MRGQEGTQEGSQKIVTRIMSQDEKGSEEKNRKEVGSHVKKKGLTSKKGLREAEAKKNKKSGSQPQISDILKATRSRGIEGTT